MFAINENNWLRIKIVGAGGLEGKNLEAVAREAVAELLLHAFFDRVTDPGEVAQYQLLGSPGLVINERVVCVGRVPTVDEVRAWIAVALQPA